MGDKLQQKLKKTRQRKIALLGLAAAAVLVIAAGFFLHSGKGGEAGQVSMEISCQKLSENMSALENEAIADYIPADGEILPREDFAIQEGETAYDLLESVCRERNIHMESSDSATYGSRYIEGIAHLYEKDAGGRSGWTYEVNGRLPDVGCSRYELQDGDKIRWVYVIDYTEDSSADEGDRDGEGADEDGKRGE